jgi:hypothetical protein
VTRAIDCGRRAALFPHRLAGHVAAALCALCLGVAVCPAGAATAPAWDRGHLQAWVGQLPSTTRAGVAVHLFDEPGLRTLLERTVPLHERRLLRRMSVESPVMQAADLLLAPVCMAHNCPSDHALLAVDMARRQVWLGLFTRTAGGTATRWYSSAAASVEVPEAALREFKSRHAP